MAEKLQGLFTSFPKVKKTVIIRLIIVPCYLFINLEYNYTYLQFAALLHVLLDPFVVCNTLRVLESMERIPMQLTLQ
jgi:hypothetical protein